MRRVLIPRSDRRSASSGACEWMSTPYRPLAWLGQHRLENAAAIADLEQRCRADGR